MNWMQAKKITTFPLFLYKEFHEFLSHSKSFRFKIINVENKEKNFSLEIMVSGMKNQIVYFSPKELVINDNLLKEFSASDVRLITFYAMKEIYTKKEATYSIIGQKFENGKTRYICKKNYNELICLGCVFFKLDYEPTIENTAAIIDGKPAIIIFKEAIYYLNKYEKIIKIKRESLDPLNFDRIVALSTNKIQIANLQQIHLIQSLLESPFEIMAKDLYADTTLLTQFNHDDLKNIISTVFLE